MKNKPMFELVDDMGLQFPYWDYIEGQQGLLVEIEQGDFCLQSNWEKGLYRFYELFGHWSV